MRAMKASQRYEKRAMEVIFHINSLAGSHDGTKSASPLQRVMRNLWLYNFFWRTHDAAQQWTRKVLITADRANTQPAQLLIFGTAFNQNNWFLFCVVNRKILLIAIPLLARAWSKLIYAMNVNDIEGFFTTRVR